MTVSWFHVIHNLVSGECITRSVAVFEGEGKDLVSIMPASVCRIVNDLDPSLACIKLIRRSHSKWV